MGEKRTIRSDSKVLVLCEGVDEKFFFMWFLDYYKKKGVRSYNLIQIEDIGGINDVQTQMALWKNTHGFEQIKVIGVIRDAEKNAIGAESSVRKALRDNGFSVPSEAFEICKEESRIPSVYAILPGFRDENKKLVNGALEDLCLAILKDDQADVSIESVNDFLAEYGKEFHKDYPRIHKNKLHTYFSADDRFVDLKIGEAAKVGAFNFEAVEMQKYKDMFDTMISSVDDTL
ncbi:MAG: hypothetical protein K6G84_12440 [Lachnospiraceae bacterium]|nr:hypothetical protein [Lachnospiraceae bacterium]